MHVAIIGYILHENKACSILCTLYRPIKYKQARWVAKVSFMPQNG